MSSQRVDDDDATLTHTHTQTTTTTKKQPPPPPSLMYLSPISIPLVRACRLPVCNNHHTKQTCGAGAHESANTPHTFLCPHADTHKHKHRSLYIHPHTHTRLDTITHSDRTLCNHYSVNHSRNAHHPGVCGVRMRIASSLRSNTIEPACTFVYGRTRSPSYYTGA